MEELSQSGRTVLLVSHQLENLLKLCDQALWIEKGRQQMMGPTEEVATAYRRHMLRKLQHRRSQSEPIGEEVERSGQELDHGQLGWKGLGFHPNG